jgi:hypothetical protein
MMLRMWVVLLALLAAPAAGAETVVRLNKPVSDAEFHRAVACAAKPGERCRSEFVRWGRRTRADLRVALLPADPGYPSGRAALVADALDLAIREINGSGAGLRLRQVARDEKPHILVTRTALKEGQRTRGVANFPDGNTIGVGQMQIWWNGDRVLERAGVLISSDIDPDDIRSVVLEEMVQALGLWHDIEGAGYAGRSIFDNDSNAVTRLKGQDIAALRLHYPR